MAGGSREGTERGATDAGAGATQQTHPPWAQPCTGTCSSLPSPGSSSTNQTRQIRHFRCGESRTKPVRFYCRSAPSGHPHGLPPLASREHHTWGAERARGDAGFGTGAMAAKGCLLIRQQLQAWACLFKGYGNSVNNPLARFGGISSPPGRKGAHMNMGLVGTQPCGNKVS